MYVFMRATAVHVGPTYDNFLWARGLAHAAESMHASHLRMVPIGKIVHRDIRVCQDFAIEIRRRMPIISSYMTDFGFKSLYTKIVVT